VQSMGHRMKLLQPRWPLAVETFPAPVLSGPSAPVTFPNSVVVGRRKPVSQVKQHFLAEIRVVFTAKGKPRSVDALSGGWEEAVRPNLRRRALAADCGRGRCRGSCKTIGSGTGFRAQDFHSRRGGVGVRRETISRFRAPENMKAIQIVIAKRGRTGSPVRRPAAPAWG